MPSSPPTTTEPAETALSVSGMNCASCVSHVEKAARSVAGVSAAQVNLARGRAVVRYDPARTDPAMVAAAITDSGYTAAPELPAAASANADDEHAHHHAAESRAWSRRALIGVLLWFPVEATHWL